MTMHPQPLDLRSSFSSDGGSSPTLSLETIAAVEQVLQELLRTLRNEAARRGAGSAREAGALEYDSWFLPPH